MIDSLCLRQVAVAAILPLRHQVLRAGLPLAKASFAGDDLPTTVHVAAMVAAMKGAAVIGCASWMAADFAGEPAYQLRGMAVAEAWRGQGVGQRLLAFSDELLAASPLTLRWCNARAVAVPFYERAGWTVVSPEFDIPTAGPHRQMMRRRLP